jgi:hypothetical protein
MTRFERGVVVAVLGVIALALVLDRQEPADEPLAQAKTPAPASLSAADVARIARRVERIRQLRFVRPVKPLFVGRAEAARLQAAGTQRDYPKSAQEADEESLKLLGLMRPSDSLGRAISAVGSEQVLGFYDPRTKRLVVVRDRHASRPLLEITLAHELTHALEDQRFGLRQGGDPNDDAAIAESALAEGSATEVMLDYGRRYFTAGDALTVLQSAGDTETELPKYVEDTLLFPYTEGLGMVETFRGQSGSWKALDNVIRYKRPATAEQVIHTDKYATGELPVRIDAPDLGLVLGGQWHRLARSSVGELDLRELFSIVGGAPDEGAAAGWGGGRFELWRRGGDPCPGPCVKRDTGLLLLAWDTSRDRAVAEQALAEAFPRGLAAKPMGGAAAARLWSSRGGVIAMAGRGKRTTVVFAPDARTAARVLAAASS